ncbi:MAG: HupE/UreJ family protein [Xanthobacteraceae bacterium]
MVAGLSLLLFIFGAEPALAHHPMGGAMPTTFWHGLLSGLGHPVIGLDHLAAVIAVGCLAATQPKGALLAVGYVIASMAGAAAHIGEATVANAEIFVALSVVALGLMLFRKEPLRRDLALALFAAAGLINGYALGETVAGAERTPIVAYFIGLALIQVSIALAVMFGMQLLTGRAALHLLTVRVAGAFAVGAGLAVILQRYVAGA